MWRGDFAKTRARGGGGGRSGGAFVEGDAMERELRTGWVRAVGQAPPYVETLLLGWGGGVGEDADSLGPGGVEGFELADFFGVTGGEVVGFGAVGLEVVEFPGLI